MLRDKPPSWIALSLPSFEQKPKKVIEDEHFYIGKLLTEKQIQDLGRIRSLIAVGGDLTPYYRRTTTFDALLRRQQIIHLHLGGPGSDTILYLIQYPEHVLFLGVDGHVHLDDIPPGKRFLMTGRKRFEQTIEAFYVERRNQLRASVQAMWRRPKPK